MAVVILMYSTFMLRITISTAVSGASIDEHVRQQLFFSFLL